jgi:hypothetical protein
MAGQSVLPVNKIRYVRVDLTGSSLISRRRPDQPVGMIETLWRRRRTSRQPDEPREMPLIRLAAHARKQADAMSIGEGALERAGLRHGVSEAYCRRPTGSLPIHIRSIR